MANTEPPKLAPEEVAGEIRRLHVQAGKYDAESIQLKLQIGSRLNRMKEQLGHGKFVAWAQPENIGMVDREARRYMRVERVLAPLVEADPTLLNRLPTRLTELDRIAGTLEKLPEEERLPSLLAMLNAQEEDAGHADEAGAGTREDRQGAGRAPRGRKHCRNRKGGTPQEWRALSRKAVAMADAAESKDPDSWIAPVARDFAAEAERFADELAAQAEAASIRDATAEDSTGSGCAERPTAGEISRAEGNVLYAKFGATAPTCDGRSTSQGRPDPVCDESTELDGERAVPAALPAEQDAAHESDTNVRNAGPPDAVELDAVVVEALAPEPTAEPAADAGSTHSSSAAAPTAPAPA